MEIPVRKCSSVAYGPIMRVQLRHSIIIPGRNNTALNIKMSQPQKFSPFSNILQPKRNLNQNLSDGGGQGQGQGQKVVVVGGQGGQSGPRSCNISQGVVANLMNLGVKSSPSVGTPTPTATGPTPTKRAPTTMAKRNARERNRVKQVNQGFQTLRHHIPDTYRMKKMSKVDTLRCALDYIRNLERILQEPHCYENNPSHPEHSPSTSLSFSSEDDELFIHLSETFVHQNQNQTTPTDPLLLEGPQGIKIENDICSTETSTSGQEGHSDSENTFEEKHNNFQY